jgi:sec-independent protein translocase protein TatA
MPAMPNIGPLEIILVLAIALVVLGPKKLPDAGRSVGRGIREFRDSLSGGANDDDTVLREAIAAPADEAGPATTGSTPERNAA